MNLRNIEEVGKLLKERFEEYGIQTDDVQIHPAVGIFTMNLIFDVGQLSLDYSVWSDICSMTAVITHHDGLVGSFLFDIQHCAYTGRAIQETYGFHFSTENNVERFIKWVNEEVRPKLTV